MIYLDTSAVVKLARVELESPALRTWLAASHERVASSMLLLTEVTRALVRSEPSALPGVSAVLTTITLIPITQDILRAAGGYPDPALRSLDAIHLATAQSLADEGILSFVVTYDQRLLVAANASGLLTACPT